MDGAELLGYGGDVLGGCGKRGVTDMFADQPLQRFVAGRSSRKNVPHTPFADTQRIDQFVDERARHQVEPRYCIFARTVHAPRAERNRVLRDGGAALRRGADQIALQVLGQKLPRHTEAGVAAKFLAAQRHFRVVNAALHQRTVHADAQNFVGRCDIVHNGVSNVCGLCGGHLDSV